MIQPDKNYRPETPQSEIKQLLSFEDQWLAKDELAREGSQLMKAINKERDSSWNLTPQAKQKIERIIRVFQNNIDKIYNSKDATLLMNQDKMKLYNFEVVRAKSYLPDETIASFKTDIEKSRDDHFKMDELEKNIGLILQYWQNQIRVIDEQATQSEQDKRKKIKLRNSSTQLQQIFFENFGKRI